MNEGMPGSRLVTPTAKFGHRSASQTVIYASIAGNVVVALSKCVAAYFTGSSAMLSEANHSIADMGNGFVALYRIRRTAARPDHDHPLGFEARRSNFLKLEQRLRLDEERRDSRVAGSHLALQFNHFLLNV
jgi:hypothetical protein